MKNILTISKREVARLRARFSGRSRAVVLAIIALTIISSGVVYHQDLVISKGLYIVGVSTHGPSIEDKRFTVVELEPETGYNLLRQGTIDLYIEGNEIVWRDDDRSQHAAGALRQYLGKQELFMISNNYDLNRAFPLRVEIRYFRASTGGTGAQTETSLLDILESTERTAQPTGTSPSRGSEVPSISRPASRGLDETGTTKAAPPSKPVSPYMLPLTEAPDESLLEVASNTDAAVRQQLAELRDSRPLPKFRAEFVSEDDVIIPSLMKPPIPLAQVIVAFLYVVPIFFVSLFFTSSFTEEKINRKLVVLLSAPVTPLEIILGKMLPYLAYSALVIVIITIALGGNVLLGLAIFTPVMLFIFSIYLAVALTYRTFKDQTFFSVFAMSAITIYLIGPTMFIGVSDLSHISPLTLAVEMYRGESFHFSEYLLATTPLYLVFLLATFLGTRVFNEEYLMGFRPLPTKVAEALYLAMDKNHLNISVLLLSMFFVPVVFIVQLVSIVFASNLPSPFTLWFLLVISVIIEEIAKSTGVVVLWQNNVTKSSKDVFIFSFLSALGFLLGEKLLVFLALGVLSESIFVSAVFGAGLLIAPLVLHVVSTSVVCLTTARLGIKYYPLAIAAGTIIHTLYNLYVIGVVW